MMELVFIGPPCDMEDSPPRSQSCKGRPRKAVQWMEENPIHRYTEEKRSEEASVSNHKENSRGDNPIFPHDEPSPKNCLKEAERNETLPHQSINIIISNEELMRGETKGCQSKEEMGDFCCLRQGVNPMDHGLGHHGTSPGSERNYPASEAGKTDEQSNFSFDLSSRRAVSFLDKNSRSRMNTAFFSCLDPHGPSPCRIDSEIQ